jgi:MIP family channel proteins
MQGRAFVAELIGTFALIFVGVCVIAHLGQADQNLGLVGIALGHGLAIACFVSATAAISGGHLNPAVSFGLWLAKKIDSATFGLFVVAQLLGGILGALAAKVCLPNMATQLIAGGTPALGKATTPLQGIVAEGITTFFLVFVIFGTAVDRRAPKLSGLFIGLTITLDILAVGPLTGGAMNPARYFGPALVAGGAALDNWYVWLVGPMIGAAAAALLYGAFLEKDPHLAADSPQRVDAQ